MKKSVLFTLFICFLSFTNYAQNIHCDVKQSGVFKDEYKNSKIILVEDDGMGGVLVVRSYYGGVFSSGRGYYFEHYDSNLKLIKEYEMEMKYSDDEKYSSVLGLIKKDDEIHLINFLYNKKDKAFICSALTSKIADFKFNRKELFRLKSEELKQFSFFGSTSGFDNDSGAQMIINEDKNAFTITVDIVDKNSETHKIYLYDDGLNQKIEHVFKREVKDKKFKYENIDVSKDGNTLYLLGKVKTDEKKNKKEGGMYQYELTKITKNSEKTQVFDTDEHFAASLKTIIFEDRLTCIGFYSDRKDSRFKGVVYYELDPTTLEIKKAKYNPFTEQFIIDKYGKNKDKELKNLSFRKILINDNNEIIFNAEEHYVTSHRANSTNGGGYTYYIYHYDDIVTVKLNQGGEIVWARNINKRQSTNDDEAYISYTSTAKGEDTYFFINTSEKVKKLSNDRILFGQTSAKKSNLNIIRVNNNGDFDFKEILDDKDSEVPFMVSDGAISGDNIYFIGRKGKKKQLLKISLK